MQQTPEKNCNNCLHRFVPCDGSPCCDCQEPHGGSPTHWQQGGSIPPLSVELGKPVQVRPSWEQYFMRMARHVATRGTCDRKRVGCVITIGKRVVATGYNGSLPGTPHCEDVGHFMVSAQFMPSRTPSASRHATA
jgi:deoxycytidylate deaminase